MRSSSGLLALLRQILVPLTAAGVLGCASNTAQIPHPPKPFSVAQLGSLDRLAIESLRSRDYRSYPRLEKTLSTGTSGTEYAQHYSSDGSKPYQSYLLSYDSDALRVYTRLDVPAVRQPRDGYPVVVFLHGWIGAEAAPASNFSYAPDAYYGRSIDSYVDGGFVVFSPGYRGHGSVDGVAADGIEFLHAWDNGSYLSPLFYAIDVLNLLEGISEIRNLQAPGSEKGVLKLNGNRIYLAGHSQGGDVALTVLAVAGEGSKVKTQIAGASIWSGTFAPRLVQLNTFYPMQATPAAFVSGDGSWNGTATGKDGSVNPDFIFGYPAPWIAQPSPEDWTWQQDTWSLSGVADALFTKATEMYGAINDGVSDFVAAEFDLNRNMQGRTTISHDARIASAMARIDAIEHPQFLTEPLQLHYSDHDYYSHPAWNELLCQRVADSGGECKLHVYPQNTHLLNVSEHRWFSDEHAQPGFQTAMDRDLSFFHRPHSPPGNPLEDLDK